MKYSFQQNLFLSFFQIGLGQMKGYNILLSEKANQTEIVRFLPRHRHFLIIFSFLLILAIFWIGFQGKFHTNFPHQPTPPAINIKRRRNGMLWNTSKLDCGRIFAGDAKYVKSKTGRNRWAMKKDPPRLDMDCEAIKERSGLDREISQQEFELPLAFARIVHRLSNGISPSRIVYRLAEIWPKDYLFLEMELLTHWVPQNWYCFVLDSKAGQQFRERIHSLGECYPNVLIAEREFDISRVGMNTSDAYLECAKELAKPERKWNYLITLQNHDLQAKTNAEMVRILDHFGGANDMEIGRLNEFTQIRLNHYKTKFNWTFEQLHIFKNDSRNYQLDANGQPMELHLSKGYSTASLSRKFIDFIFDELDLTILLRQLNNGYFGMDEHLWQSIGTTDGLNMPGGFPQKCFECKRKKCNADIETMNGKMNFVTRFALWMGDERPCRSGNVRHAVCVFGLEDLAGPDLVNLPHLFVNKMMPEFDVGAVLCWNERMRNRTMDGEIVGQLNETIYKEWPQERYQKLREEFEGREEELRANFNCKSGKLLKAKN